MHSRTETCQCSIIQWCNQRITYLGSGASIRIGTFSTFPAAKTSLSILSGAATHAVRALWHLRLLLLLCCNLQRSSYTVLLHVNVPTGDIDRFCLCPPERAPLSCKLCEQLQYEVLGAQGALTSIMLLSIRSLCCVHMPSQIFRY